MTDHDAEFPEAVAVPGSQAGSPPARLGPAAAETQTAAGKETPGLPLVLELVITAAEPLSGTVAVAGSQRPQEFHGWIDLMSAISLLREGREADPPQPGSAAQAG
ncbi:MAG TPA: hypothetical protein VEL03_10265 [Streptosporangiaceae bacterium]|nr:hypothetical protein [Streptosporangiaceae bacterium]